MRICKWYDQPAVNKKASPVCAFHRENPTQRPCAKCSAIPRALDSAYCKPCRDEIGRRRPIRRKTCIECATEFRTKSSSDRCPRCMHERRKHPCADCGTRVDARSERCMPCWGKTRRGPNSASWRGGRTIQTASGYVLRRVQDHPLSNGAGYVREHVLVMENVLGRFLLPGETVHHKNGQRDDNRPDNLELWVKSQPAGQRAEDLVAWAREILATYD